MSTKGIESLVLEAPCARSAHRYPDRVGWYHDDKLHWTFPTRLAPELIYVGHPWSFGVKAALRSWQAGIRWLRWLGDPARLFERQRIASVFAIMLARSVAYRVRKALAGSFLEPLLSQATQRVFRKLARLRRIQAPAVPRRITLVVSGLGPGGTERQVVNAMLGLAASDCRDLALLHERSMQPPDDFYLPRLTSARIAVERLQPLHARPLNEWAFDDELLDLARILDHQFAANVEVLPEVFAYFLEFKRRRPEVVHTWLDYMNVTAGLAAALVGVPRVVLSCRSVTPTHFDLYQPFMKPTYQYLAQYPSVTMLNNSHAGAADYERWLGLRAGTVRVIYNGLNADEVPTSDAARLRGQSYRQRFGIPVSASVVGTVIRMTEEKRPLLWVQVAAAVARRNSATKFLLVGDGPLRNEIENAAKHLGVSEQLILVGHEKDAFSAIAAMDVFLLTSRMEGLPNVLIEAQAVGVPVVAVAVGGVAETFEDGVTGMAVQDSSVDSLAGAVDRVLKDSQIRATARARGPDLVKSRFGMPRMVTELMKVYGMDVSTEAPAPASPRGAFPSRSPGATS